MTTNEQHGINRRASQDILNSRFAEALRAGVVNPERRLASKDCFRTFCESYGGAAFSLGWSAAHLECIEKIESSTVSGESFSLALPRGSGKSTLCHWALIWALLYGHVEYAIYVGATANNSNNRRQSIKTTLRFNDELAEDFPEVILPIRFTENEARKAAGQRFNGEPTDIQWSSSDKLIFPTLQNYETELSWLTQYDHGLGGIMDFASLEAGLRGKSVERSDGRVIRPQLAVVDDPSTRESAASPAQNLKRMQILNGDIGYLGSPERPCGVIVPCTIIFEDDLAHQLMNHDKCPEFKGVCHGLINNLPWENMDEAEAEEISKLWEQDYAELRRFDLLEGTKNALDFYVANKDKMVGTCIPAWDERKNKDDADAIQYAMDLYLKDAAAFYAEMMNQPVPLELSDKIPLKPDDIIKHGINVNRRVALSESDFCTAFIDISRNVLWWTVVAFNKETYRSHVVDYGVFPDQKKPYVTLATAKKTIPDRYPEHDYSVALTKTLDELVNHLLGMELVNEAGSPITIDKVGIDSGWGTEADTVYNFCKRSSHKRLLVATKGFGSTPLKKPLVDPEKKREPRSNLTGQWKFIKNRSGTDLLLYDTNLWKTRCDNAYRLTPESSSAFTIFNAKVGGREPNHNMLAEQLTAEKSMILEGGGRRIESWSNAGNKDNHLGDCVVGCFVLASVLGATIQTSTSIAGLESKKPRARKRRRWTTNN